MAAERLSRRRRSLCHDGVCRDEDVIHGVIAQADGYPIACVLRWIYLRSCFCGIERTDEAKITLSIVWSVV